MAKTDFFKCYGAEKRQDSLVELGKDSWLLIYGYGTDGEQGYNLRKYYDHKPTLDEVKRDVRDAIDTETKQKILEGFEFNGIKVWLSDENQRNYASIERNDSVTYPLTLKLNEESDGTAVYCTFPTAEDFEKFSKEASLYILNTVMAGWQEKDGVEWSVFGL